MGLGPHCKHVQVEVLFVDYGFILDLDLEEMIQNTCAYQQHEGWLVRMLCKLVLEMAAEMHELQ